LTETTRYRYSRPFATPRSVNVWPEAGVDDLLVAADRQGAIDDDVVDAGRRLPAQSHESVAGIRFQPLHVRRRLAGGWHGERGWVGVFRAPASEARRGWLSWTRVFPLASRAVNVTTCVPTVRKLGASCVTTGCGSTVSVALAPDRNPATAPLCESIPEGVSA